MEKIYEIGHIGNYYGGLQLKKKKGKYYWGIEDWDDTRWQKIDRVLALNLLRYKIKE